MHHEGSISAGFQVSHASVEKQEDIWVVQGALCSKKDGCGQRACQCLISTQHPSQLAQRIF